MRRLKPVILLLAVMAFFLWGKWYFYEPEEVCITRAQAARMLAYALYDMEEQQEEGRTLIDVEDGIWYADEIRMVVGNDLMQTDGDLFHPTDFLTYSEAGDIAHRLQKDLEIPPLKEKIPIPVSVWLDLYDEVIDGLDSVEVKRLTVDAVPAISDELKSWQAKTSEGIFIYEGVPLDNYIGQEVIAYVRGDQLLMALRPEERYAAESVKAEIIEAGQASDVHASESGQTGTGTTDDEMDNMKNENPSADLSEKESNIRVCLMTTGFSSEYHEKVTVMADTDWCITFKDSIRQCLPGETVTLTAEDFDEDGDVAEIRTVNGKITETSADTDRTAMENEEGGMLQLLSIERSCGFPAYEGVLKVQRSGSTLLLVNILPLEHYLYGVVPGEMPSNYGSEALKAQAVCARSYAMLSLQSPKYDFADVNDSTACQVYMNQGISESCCEAVDATAGEVLISGGEIVSAKYFSTSCGSMSDSDDIWLYPEEAEALAHIAARLETQPPSLPSLDDETVFRQFIDAPEAETYVEENEPWFRWRVMITPEEIGQNMEKSLKQRMAVNPKHFTVLTVNGEIDTDDIQSVEILDRAVSGVVRKIRISGKNQELAVSGEYNIRCLLAPSEQSVILNDGSEKTGLSLLPSGYFYLAEQMDGDYLTGYEIRGGGLGHGAGLSQNGARVLADQGYDYKAILSYYFDNIAVGNAS